MKNLLCKKLDTCKNGTESQWKDVKRNVTVTIGHKKNQYMVKLENRFASGKWHGMQIITGYKKKEK